MTEFGYVDVYFLYHQYPGDNYTPDDYEYEITEISDEEGNDLMGRADVIDYIYNNLNPE